MAEADFTRIATNIGALNALNSLRSINSRLGLHQQRLATGKRINTAADDPAGLTIATKMKARSEGLKTAIDNIGDAKNLLSVAEAGLGQITDILIQMRNKAEQAASDTLGSSEREAIASQIESMAAQIDDLVSETKWNGVQLLDGNINKRFQTGADDGEYTVWQLTQKHTASSLNVADSNETAQITDIDTSTSLGTASTAGVFGGLTELATGTYSFEILAKAADATDGYVDVNGTLLSGVSAVAVTTSGTEELASDTYTITIDAVASSVDVSYTIRNSAGDVVESVSNANINDGVLDGNGGTALGVELTYTNDASDLQVGDTMTFEYIKKGQVKLQLEDGSGQAVQIDKDGSSTNTTTTTFAYVDAGGNYDTGRGIRTAIAAIGSVTAGDKYTLSYERAGDHVVDVSTAAKASTYMQQVNNALDVVNKSMSDLGSLMARLSIKEEAVAVAQVNTEAAYNRIMNADMAFEQVEATKFSILQQTAITMLSQANTSPQGILGLFR